MEGDLQAGDKVDETVDKITHPKESALEKAFRKIDEGVEDAKDAVTPDK